MISKGSDLKEEGFIPPKYKKEFLKDLMDNKKCICGRELSENSEEYEIINQLYGRTSGITNISEEVNVELNSLEPLINSVHKFLNTIKKHNINIRDYEKIIEKKNETLEDTKLRLSKIDNEDIQRLLNNQTDYENLIEKNIEIKAVKNEKIEGYLKELEKIKRREEKISTNNEKVEKLNNMLNFCEEVINISDTLESKIIENIRIKIEKYTSDQFLNLMWKVNFKGIKIDKDYNVSILNNTGYALHPNDISAGERLILALSFVTALNQISGFNLPLIIDSPMGRLDKEIKINLAKILPNYVVNKQVILLVLGEEYTSDFHDGIKEKVGKKYAIEANEKQEGTISKIIESDVI
jgi:DNA sulfur modification protein DndD